MICFTHRLGYVSDREKYQLYWQREVPTIAGSELSKLRELRKIGDQTVWGRDSCKLLYLHWSFISSYTQLEGGREGANDYCGNVSLRIPLKWWTFEHFPSPKNSSCMMPNKDTSLRMLSLGQELRSVLNLELTPLSPNCLINPSLTRRIRHCGWMADWVPQTSTWDELLGNRWDTLIWLWQVKFRTCSVKIATIQLLRKL